MKIIIFTEKNIKKFISILMIFFSISILNLPYFTQIKNFIHNIVTCQVAKDIASKSDNFLSVFLGYDFLMNDLKPSITLPYQNYELKDGVFYFSMVEDSIIKNGADGIVKSIGYNGEEKYIEILHNGNIKSVFVNVDIIGVNTNLKVSKGDIISTQNQNGKLKFYLTYNDEIITDFVVENGEIIWQN